MKLAGITLLFLAGIHLDMSIKFAKIGFYQDSLGTMSCALIALVLGIGAFFIKEEKEV